ncbi:MAG: response regulator [Gemmataceae bacterium]
MSNKTVLSVGQCDLDHDMISRLIGSLGGEVRRVHNAQQTIEELANGCFALVLVNRVFDLDGGDGQALIRELKKRYPQLPVMLVSNYADAQETAQAAGAEPGFGKAALHAPETAERLKKYLG